MLHRAEQDRSEGALDANPWSHVDEVLEAILVVAGASVDDGFHERLAQGLADALGCHTAFVSEFIDDQGSERVRTLAIWSRGSTVENFEYPLSDTPCAEVIRSGRLQVERNVCDRFPHDDFLTQVHADSYLGVVLRGSDGRVAGHLAVLDDRPLLDSPSNRSIIDIFAVHASMELDRRSVGSHLRVIEDNFRILFEHSPNAIILFDPETWKPEEFNDQAAQIMGFSREEFARLTISDLEMESHPEETREHITRILQSGSDEFEALHKAKDGSPRHVVVSLRMTVWKGRPMMLTLWHDITARKAAERALETSERRLQSIFDSAIDAVVILDGELRLNQLNPAAESLFGGSSADMQDLPARDLFPGPEADHVFERARGAVRRGGKRAPFGHRRASMHAGSMAYSCQSN